MFEVRRSVQLVATAGLEDRMRRYVSGAGTSACVQPVVVEAARWALSRLAPDETEHPTQREESFERYRSTARSRVNDLWQDALARGPRNPSRFAVLLCLAGLSEVPMLEAMGRPGAEWLDAVVDALLDDATGRYTVARTAPPLLPTLCRRLGLATTPRLTLGYASTILSRIKAHVLG